MSSLRGHIIGTGAVCAIGENCEQILKAIEQGRSGLRPLTRFKISYPPVLPVGEVSNFANDHTIPRTHQMARKAADQAMGEEPQPPDAIIIGCTTGGMATTEELFKQDCYQQKYFRYHGLGTVAEDLSRRYHCKGPVLTVSTACSSGSAALAIALAMIRSGQYSRILAGGVDVLCRMTYFGFKSLQLIDPSGARPLDQHRRGMSVAEGAGMLLIEGVEKIPSTGIELMGGGLSCDAHHPAQPHPDGKGALSAMQGALSSAGLNAKEIDYINLHGTGTLDNDHAEMRAINTLYGDAPPPISSIKGATGHCLAAAGAVEAVVAVQAMERRLIPANIGCQKPDPLLSVTPVRQVIYKPIQTVLSNSFGFGGNNASVVLGYSRGVERKASDSQNSIPFEVVGLSAITGAGMTMPTFDNFSKEICCAGKLDIQQLGEGLPLGSIRRLKRLSIMALNLLSQTQTEKAALVPKSIFLGTGWGSLSESYDFLKDLFASNDKFSSPTDFIGSVHNAAAGQISLMIGATGPNLTLTGGEYSFEQALFSAQFVVDHDDPFMVIGLDEAHEFLSPLFDVSVSTGQNLADGGGALILKRTLCPKGPTVRLRYLTTDFTNAPDVQDLVKQLGGTDQINSKYGILLVGIPLAQKTEGQQQLEQFLTTTAFPGKVIDYRRLTGEFATASAVATVMATAFVKKQQIAKEDQTKAVLVLGMGSALTAVDVI